MNVDSKSYKITEENMGHPDRQEIAMHLMMMKKIADNIDDHSLGFRWTFDIACAHLYYLMTSDSYSR